MYATVVVKLLKKSTMLYQHSVASLLSQSLRRITDAFGDAEMRIFVTRELDIALGRRTVTRGVLALPVCVG